jgi:hypothetical protein
MTESTVTVKGKLRNLKSLSLGASFTKKLVEMGIDGRVFMDASSFRVIIKCPVETLGDVLPLVNGALGAAGVQVED